MEILRTIEALRAWQARANGPLGFVPTMGALHAGHGSLIERSVAEQSVTLVSIFVNATQFNDAADCVAYPKPLEADLALCERLGAAAVFLPGHAEMYPDGYRYRVSEQVCSLELEGRFRPGHFDGMLTVVLKLLQLAQAQVAYFGEKDWQQLQLVRGLVTAFFLRTRICAVATVREPDGLALSSRNVRLSPAARALAPRLYHWLCKANSAAEARAGLEADGFIVEYVEDRDGRRLAAAVLDGVRLIDNIALTGER